MPGRKAALLRERLGAESHLLRYGAIAETGRNPARLIPELRAFIDEHRGQRVRYVSEAIWPGRSAAELCEATRHEALMNLAFASSAATIVCPYDIGGLAPSVVGGAERTHPAFLRDGRTQSAAGYAGWAWCPPSARTRCPRRPPTLRCSPTRPACGRCATWWPATAPRCGWRTSGSPTW